MASVNYKKVNILYFLFSMKQGMHEIMLPVGVREVRHYKSWTQKIVDLVGSRETMKSSWI